MASMFRRDPRTKITPLFRTLLSEIALRDPDLPLHIAIDAAAQACDFADADIEGLAERLVQMSQATKAEKPKSSSGKSAGYGKAFTRWINSLDSDSLFLWLADFDPARAERLYREVDVDDLKVIVDAKVSYEWEVVRTRLEASIVGAGGKLEGESNGVVREHNVDMSNTNDILDMESKLRSLGFC